MMKQGLCIGPGLEVNAAIVQLSVDLAMEFRQAHSPSSVSYVLSIEFDQAQIGMTKSDVVW